MTIPNAGVKNFLRPMKVTFVILIASLVACTYASTWTYTVRLIKSEDGDQWEVIKEKSPEQPNTRNENEPSQLAPNAGNEDELAQLAPITRNENEPSQLAPNAGNEDELAQLAPITHIFIPDPEWMTRLTFTLIGTGVMGSILPNNYPLPESGLFGRPMALLMASFLAMLLGPKRPSMARALMGSYSFYTLSSMFYAPNPVALWRGCLAVVMSALAETHREGKWKHVFLYAFVMLLRSLDICVVPC